MKKTKQKVMLGIIIIAGFTVGYSKMNSDASIVSAQDRKELFIDYVIERNDELIDIKMSQDYQSAHVWTDEGEYELTLKEGNKVEIKK